MKNTLYLAVAVFSILAIGCSGNSQNSVKFEGTTWVYQSEQTDLPQATVVFDDNRISGFSGVNNFFSELKISDKNLEISKVGVTRMMGAPKAMEFENSFLDSFELVESYKLKNDILTLYNGNKEKVLSFTAFCLKGTYWILDAIQSEEGMLPPTSDLDITLSFTSETDFSIFDGINNQFGSYESLGGTIVLQASGSTMVAGTPDAEMLANQYNQLIAKAITYKVHSNQLTLFDIDKNPLLRFYQTVIQEETLTEIPMGEAVTEIPTDSDLSAEESSEIE